MESLYKKRAYQFMDGGGELGSLIRSFEWSKTTLGYPDTWPQHLRTTISIMLNSPTPMFLMWGPDFIQFYNDAYRLSLGNNGKHPAALGQKAIECWPEIWNFLEPNINQVYYEGKSIKYEDQLVPIYRNGALEDVYWTFSYSPVKNENGTVDGILALCNETTKLVSRFRNLVEQAPGPILILKGEDLVLEVANQSLFELWNVGPEAIGKSFMEILPEMKDQVFFGLLKDVLHNGKTHYGYETPAVFHKKDGEKKLIYVNFIYQPYREADGSISGVLVMATEVTEKVKAFKKAEESERNFRSLILQAPVPISIYKGPDLVIDLANESALRFTGGNTDVIGKRLKDVLPEIEGQGFIRLLENVMINEQPYFALEAPVKLNVNGQEQMHYLNFVYQPFYKDDGSVDGVLAIANDVTEQVVTRKKIEDSEERTRLAIDSADLGTFDLNLNNYTVITSKRFDNIFGYRSPQLHTRYVETIHPADRLSRDKAFINAIQSGNLEYQGRIIWSDNTTHWVRIKGKVYFNEKNEPLKIIGVAQDITDQKQFAEELSKQVEERTMALREANERLERSNADLEQFAYVTSHDLQEPLRKIQIFNGFLAEKLPVDTDEFKYAIKVGESAKRMSGLIKDLLEYSRISQTLKRFEKTDLSLILKNVLFDFEYLIDQKNAVIKTDPLPTIEAIPLQMNQLFFNLIGNALKFSRKDVLPVITIKAQTLSDERRNSFANFHHDKEYIEICFQDNGIGFNQEYADKIFTIFQRLNERSQYGGYGIGLALCKKIIDTHKGIIYAQGRPREGASISFILPCFQE